MGGLHGFRALNALLDLPSIHRRHDHRAALVEELLPRFLFGALDRDFDGAADGVAGGSFTSRSAPSRASAEMAMVVLAGRLRSGK